MRIVFNDLSDILDEIRRHHTRGGIVRYRIDRQPVNRSGTVYQVQLWVTAVSQDESELWEYCGAMGEDDECSEDAGTRTRGSDEARAALERLRQMIKHSPPGSRLVVRPGKIEMI